MTKTNANPDGMFSLMQMVAFKAEDPYIIIKLRSNVKAENWLESMIKFSQVNGERELLAYLAATVEQMIQRHGDMFNDNHDPESCVRTAFDLWAEIKAA